MLPAAQPFADGRLRILQHTRRSAELFVQALRYFRNYVHPYEQMASGFAPRQQTAKICLQVLKAAIHDIHENMNRIGTQQPPAGDVLKAAPEE